MHIPRYGHMYVVKLIYLSMYLVYHEKYLNMHLGIITCSGLGVVVVGKVLGTCEKCFGAFSMGHPQWLS